MADWTDAELDQLIKDIGLKEPRELRPCGTLSAYSRHLKRGEKPCEACRQANTEAKAKGSAPMLERRKPIAHGTYAGFEQHMYRRETPCAACKQASRDRQRRRYWAARGGAS